MRQSAAINRVAEGLKKRVAITQDQLDKFQNALAQLTVDKRRLEEVATERRDKLLWAEQRCAALEEELRGVREDAERYRWLRDEAGDRMVMRLISSGSDYWDAAIDAARSAEGQGGETI